jgi:F0F1-type ATP synthase membrane subunit c/vacuolar-type H+-ATPase subunit K
MDEKKRTVKRIGSAINGLVYLGFGILALATVTAGSSGGNTGSDATAGVLRWPGGQSLVFIGGLVVIAIAVGLTVRGLKTDFEKHLQTARMSPTTFKAVRRLGQAGYVARGVVFGLVGIFVCKAAMDYQPGEAGGFDVALKSIAGAPFGQFLLILAAVGLVCFGAYCLAEARYRRL